MRKDSTDQLNTMKSCLEEQFSSALDSGTSKRRTDDNDAIQLSSNPSSNKRPRLSKDISSTKKTCESKLETNQNKKEKTQKKTSDSHLELTWICTECREAECATQPDSPLLVCEGVCSRPFHYPCAGLAALPPADEEWICSDCKESRHQCAVCHEYGADDVDVHKCRRKDCGLFFHEACLTMYDVDVQVQIANGQESGNEDTPLNADCNTPDGYDAVTSIQFICPAHRCWTCSDGVPLSSQEELGKTLEANESSNVKGKKKKSKDALSLSFKEKNELLFVSSCLFPSNCFKSFVLGCIHAHYFYSSAV